MEGDISEGQNMEGQVMEGETSEGDTTDIHRLQWTHSLNIFKIK